MSYDLAVFDPRPELRDARQFRSWYEQSTEWSGELDYDSPEKLTPGLKRWFEEMAVAFPPLNGPLAYEGDDEGVRSAQADYTLGRDIIYAAFGWSKADEAYEACLRLAEKHGVGFLDVSGEQGAAWFPDASGALQVVHAAGDE